MAATSTAPLPLFLGGRKTGNHTPLAGALQPPRERARRSRAPPRVSAGAGGGSRRKRAPPGVDTRIHWESEEEGWVGGGKNSDSKSEFEQQQQSMLGEKFADLLNESSGSHYQFLGVAPDADLEEIKAAYRRLSKEYHPDTTSLPIKAASEKFMRLREIYDELSDDERRRFYDWTLAQEAASLQAERMKMKFEDPRFRDYLEYEPVPDMVDRLGGKNMKLSDQAMTALTFDLIAIVFSICCVVYAIFFKEY